MKGKKQEPSHSDYRDFTGLRIQDTWHIFVTTMKIRTNNLDTFLNVMISNKLIYSWSLHYLCITYQKESYIMALVAKSCSTLIHGALYPGSLTFGHISWRNTGHHIAFLRLTVFINILRSEKCVVKINHLTVAVKGTNIFTYGDYIFFWEFITALDMESLGIPWEVWRGQSQIRTRGGDNKFPSSVIFSILISFVAPDQVFINFRSSLAQFLTKSWCRCQFEVFWHGSK